MEMKSASRSGGFTSEKRAPVTTEEAVLCVCARARRESDAGYSASNKSLYWLSYSV
jgi:hypothetical protein